MGTLWGQNKFDVPEQKRTVSVFFPYLITQMIYEKVFFSIQLFYILLFDPHFLLLHICIFFNLKTKQCLDRHNILLPLQSKYQVLLPSNKKSNYQFEE